MSIRINRGVDMAEKKDSSLNMKRRDFTKLGLGIGNEENAAPFVGLLQTILRSARFSFHAFLLFKSMNTPAFSPVNRQAKGSASLKLNSVYSGRNRQTLIFILMQSSTAPTPRQTPRSAVRRRDVRQANAPSVARTSATLASPPFNCVSRCCSPPANEKAERHCHSAFDAILIAL